MRFGVRYRYDLRTWVYDALLLPGLVLLWSVCYRYGRRARVRALWRVAVMISCPSASWCVTVTMGGLTPVTVFCGWLPLRAQDVCTL